MFRKILFIFTFCILIISLQCKKDDNNIKSGSDDTVILEIGSNEIRIDEDKLYYEAESGIQKSNYDVYVFDLSEFQEKTGELPDTNTISLEVKIKNSETKTLETDDPNIPTPDGGIQFNYHYCEIIKKID